MNKSLTFDDYVKLTIDSGVPPIELTFVPVVDIEQGKPFAFRTKTVINSVTMGVLDEKNYVFVSDVKDCGVELLKRNIMRAVVAFDELEKSGFEISFLTVRCPSTMPEKTSLYDLVKDVLSKFGGFAPEHLCLEFPASLFDENAETVRKAVLDMKLLKVKTAVIGCGTEDFVISKFLSAPVDYAFLDATATKWAGDRNKPKYLLTMIDYINSMGVEVFAEGDAEYRKLLRNTACKGFVDGKCKPQKLDQIKSEVANGEAQ